MLFNPSTAPVLRSVNPANNEIIQDYPEHSPEEVSEILGAADSAARSWARTSFADRSALMRIAAIILRERREELARLMALEMGKPVAGGRSEVDKCAWVCEYYADHAEGFLTSEVIETDATTSYVACRPLGVVLAIMPWNFPLWQVFRFAAPTLMSGNGGLLKHASNVTGTALAIEEIFREAGFPQHLFRTLKIDQEQVASVIQAPVVKAVTLTGSVRAGRAVAAEAGASLKKTVLELGGSDPYVILEDADLDLAART
ncbi:MAG: aldehyde dehydrogenase family protein, partial [Rhodothermales bacterium]|nr:aldehyde dehydrogenase family protein [Rhodothermales bacterium]